LSLPVNAAIKLFRMHKQVFENADKETAERLEKKTRILSGIKPPEFLPYFFCIICRCESMQPEA
jgi:hypothetical protein